MSQYAYTLGKISLRPIMTHCSIVNIFQINLYRIILLFTVSVETASLSDDTGVVHLFTI